MRKKNWRQKGLQSNDGTPLYGNQIIPDSFRCRDEQIKIFLLNKPPHFSTLWKKADKTCLSIKNQSDELSRVGSGQQICFSFIFVIEWLHHKVVVTGLINVWKLLIIFRMFLMKKKWVGAAVLFKMHVMENTRFGDCYKLKYGGYS